MTAKAALSTELDVQSIGRDRVRIRPQQLAVGAPTGEVRELMQWLSARREVVGVEYHEDTGSIEVAYRDAAGSGAFVRSLRDRVFTLARPAPVSDFRVELAHSLAGRARLRLIGASAEQNSRLAAWVGAQPGIIRASASPASQSILVQFDPDLITAKNLLAAISESDPLGWPAAPPEPKRTQWGTTAFNTAVLATAFSGLAPAPAMAAAVVITALPSARRALRALGEKRVGVDMLDVAAIGISIGTGQPGTAAFITWLLGLGDLVLEHTGDRARDAISKLMKLDASDAWRIREVSGEETIEKVSVKKLSVGDRIVIDPGQRVAADGIVVRGVALTDEKALTGESIPQEKRQGDRVLAASVVVEGQIVVEIDRTGKDTTAAKIVQILEGAGAKPMTLQRNAEKVADRLVLPTFGIAGGAALFASQIDRMTSVLITDFGTGIRIAVPTSALTAMTIAARQGVLVKGGQFLERLAKADAIVFDKTGTLTGGAPSVFEVIALGELDAEESVALAAAAEARQQHPIAEAIRRYAVHRGVSVPDADFGSEAYSIGIGLRAAVDQREVLVGGRRLMERHGISSEPATSILERHRELGASSIFVAIEGRLEAVIGYADEPRPESAAVVRALKANGRREIILMSGDARGPVDAVAKAIGVDRALFELLPEEKAAHVRALQREGKIVAMVGDGINDAPALAVADVGISLEGGTDVALETADVVLLEGGLLRLPHAFDIADEAMAHVRRGLGLVLVPNGVAIVLGALGLISPGVAAVVNNGSTVVAAVTALAPLLNKRPRRAKLLT